MPASHPLVPSRYVEAEILMAATWHTLPPWKVMMLQWLDPVRKSWGEISKNAKNPLCEERCVTSGYCQYFQTSCICCIIHFKTRMPVTTLKREMSEPLPALCRAPPRLCKPQIGAKDQSITKRDHSKSSAKIHQFFPLILMGFLTRWMGPRTTYK